ncbi:hypothetical protein AVEN_204128-1 [Araneus ventricosus]|uniref:Uncharacterized protein n=1 Tax=Araneus ventricosus TaxID=182803 RepID=A0A4Y2V4L5_ARAVE|nr:hypothetical protein AVEN_264581-1 [Araneus ventricosus]GBO19366.1 hypothetical protein AVEN_204128-1 [Araneus ventricosus]
MVVFEHVTESPGFSRGRCDLVVRSRLWCWRATGLKPDSTDDPSCMWAWYTLNMTALVKCPLAGVVRKFEDGVAVQVSSSSSDLDSKS